MIKRGASLIITIMTILCFGNFTAYAKEYNIDGIRIEIEDNSILLPGGIEHSSDEVHDPKRGSIISFAMASVDNDGNGDMTFRIDTFAYVACDEIRHKAYVDVWNEETQDWDTIETVLFYSTKDMTPDEPLVALNNSFTVKNLKLGNYYRLTGAHMVKLDGKIETLSTCTDGVKNELH